MHEELHRTLARLNRARLTPGRPGDDWRVSLAREFALRERELVFLDAERGALAERASTIPHEPARFLRWFESLEETGPGQRDPLFPWLATHATLVQVRWFLRQEIAGETGFDDLVALAQLKLPDRPKLELARNYWDEMGRGEARGMHGPMLARLGNAVVLDENVQVVWESLAVGNLMAGLAANRRYAYHAIGALGVVELTEPARAVLINAALKRCGVPSRARQYYAVHAAIDLQHSAAWLREVIAPLVAADAAVAQAIGEGALLRLVAGARCFARYRAELGVAAASRAA